jgi:hypothetical protein
VKEDYYLFFFHLSSNSPPAVLEVSCMDYELIAIILGAVLPLYPALFGIYQKIGKYDVLCNEFGAHIEEQNRIKEAPHGSRNHPDH